MPPGEPGSRDYEAQHLDPGVVDAVVLSHLHGDHFGGLPFLILDGQFTRRRKTLTVLGPAGTRDRLHQAMETLYPGSASARRRFPVEIIELGGDGDRQHSGPLTVASWQVDHASGAPALAVRARLGEATFGYSGDTAWTPALLAAAEDTDLFACEAYTYDTPVRYHLDYRTLCQHVGEFTTGQLILTHMGPSMLSRLGQLEHNPRPRRAAPGPVTRTRWRPQKTQARLDKDGCPYEEPSTAILRCEAMPGQERPVCARAR